MTSNSLHNYQYWYIAKKNLNQIVEWLTEHYPSLWWWVSDVRTWDEVLDYPVNGVLIWFDETVYQDINVVFRLTHSDNIMHKWRVEAAIKCLQRLDIKGPYIEWIDHHAAVMPFIQ